MWNISTAAAETFFQELCTDLAFGQGPAPRQVISTSVGMGFQLLPSGEARANLYQVDQEAFTGHTQGFVSVVSPEGRHGMSDILKHYRGRFEVHPDGEAGEPEQEQLWVEVVQWDDDNLVGKLVEGGTRTTEWRKGSHVEVDDSQINALDRKAHV